MANFPDVRLRRLREREPVRNMARETRLSVKEFVYPVFVTHGSGVREPIEPMPGCYHLSLDTLTEEAAEAAELGVPAVAAVRASGGKGPFGHGGLRPGRA